MLHGAFGLERGPAPNELKVWKLHSGDSNGDMAPEFILAHECGAHESPCCGGCFWREWEQKTKNVFVKIEKQDIRIEK